MVEHSEQSVAYVRVSTLDQNPDRQLAAVAWDANETMASNT